MFRKISDAIYASPQISVDDIAAASELGIGLVINNRPEAESEDQTPGTEIEAAAVAAGMKYLAIPVTHSGFSEPQIKAMVRALESTEQPILAYCRSGTRSTLLWSLAEASRGMDPQKIAACASNAGYDVSPIQPMIDMLAAAG